MMDEIKIALIAPSGFGKSTIANILVKEYNFQLFKLATPIYEIQKIIYDKIGADLKGQDGELLQFLGQRIQKIKPEFLASEFFSKLTGNLIVNDDCRPHNYQYLKNNGFVFIYVDSYCRERNTDHSQSNPNHEVEWNKDLAKKSSDFILENQFSLEDLKNNIKNLMEDILDK